MPMPILGSVRTLVPSWIVRHVARGPQLAGIAWG